MTSVIQACCLLRSRRELFGLVLLLAVHLHGMDAAAQAQASQENIQLRSAQLQVTLSPVGAELVSVQDLETGYEYLWQDEPGLWHGPAPLLFPVIGGLQGKQYQHKGKSYALPFHGFARNSLFQVTQQSDGFVEFHLESSADSLKNYPFPFTLTLSYRLKDSELVISARVQNTGTEILPASVGFHPAFNVCLAAPGEAPVALLDIESSQPLMELTKDPDSGLLDGKKQAWTQGKRSLPLLHETFGKTALILQSSAPMVLRLDNTISGRKVTLRTDSPYLGLWRKQLPKATFLCLEPWWGITDPVMPYGDITNKPGIQLIAVGDSLQASFALLFQ